jgi:hypothetical protein
VHNIDQIALQKSHDKLFWKIVVDNTPIGRKRKRDFKEYLLNNQEQIKGKKDLLFYTKTIIQTIFEKI